jgi:hypothetical protein
VKLVYLGADVPSNRVILEAMGVQNVGVSFWRLVKRGLPKNKRYMLENYFSPFMRIHVHPGIPEGTELTEAELEEFAYAYEDFLAHNIERIDSFIEIDHPLIDKLSMDTQRKAAWSEVEPEKFWAVIRSDYSYAEITELCQQYQNVAIPYATIEGDVSMAAKTRALTSQYGTKFHALACAKPDNLRQIHVESASTMSWLSPMMRGETIVWDGNKLVRYPKKMKDQARPRYKAIYEKAKLDFDKIIGDDPVEVAKLALWSYDQFEERFNMVNNPYMSADDDFENEKELYDNSEDLQGVKNAETNLPVHDNKGSGMRKLVPRDKTEMGTLPVFGVEYSTVVEQDDNGNDIIKDVPTLRSQTNSLRLCDTCFVASNCPAFKPQNTCAFNLPIEVKTKEQLKALINAIIEMQGQRIAFARFSEEINGGYPDPNTSQEIDRLFKLIKTVKELDDSREFIRMTVERQGSGGVLSAIFGDKAQALNDLPNGGIDNENTTRIIQQAIEE